jgi:hypothetical protein
MRRYECQSKLNISVGTNSSGDEKIRTVTIWLEHRKRHTPYYDVALPPEAAEMIREHLDWTTPNEIARKVKAAYPTVSTMQVHKAWTAMSEMLWKRNADQIASARVLLAEDDNVDLLTIATTDGVEQVAWVMKRIANALRGKIVEIGIDATCKRSPKYQHRIN